MGNILFIKSTSLFHGVHSKQTLLDICASITPCHQARAGPAGRAGSHTASCRLQGPLGRYEQRGASLRVDSILHHCPPTIPRDTLCFHILEALQGPGVDPHPARRRQDGPEDGPVQGCEGGSAESSAPKTKPGRGLATWRCQHTRSPESLRKPCGSPEWDPRAISQKGEVTRREKTVYFLRLTRQRRQRKR